MDGFCDKAIRCLCSCLIKKEIVQYAEVSDEHSKFMSPHDPLDEEAHHKMKPLPQDSLK